MIIKLNIGKINKVSVFTVVISKNNKKMITKLIKTNKIGEIIAT